MPPRLEWLVLCSVQLVLNNSRKKSSVDKHCAVHTHNKHKKVRSFFVHKGACGAGHLRLRVD